MAQRQTMGGRVEWGQIMMTLSPSFEKMPPELTSLPRWVVWRAVYKDGPNSKATKIPYDAKAINSHASSTDPGTWASFDEAVTAFEERLFDSDSYAGVGFVLNGDGIGGIDIDGCVKDGQIDPRARELLDSVEASYIEFSPSGTGLRAFGYAPPLDRGCAGVWNGLKIELYTSGRYLTLTGHLVQAGEFKPLQGFAKLAELIRGDRKADPKTGEIVSVAPDQKHAELLRRIRSGDVFHNSLRDMAASLVASGLKPGAAVTHLRALMDDCDSPKDERWEARRKQIPDLVASAAVKFTPPPDTGEIFPPIPDDLPPVEPVEPVDPFTHHPVPPFPLEVLPEVFSDYAKACSQGSGFDAGAYGFSLLVLASGMVDHRARLQAGPLRVPPHLWGSLSADSGGGKSPILNAASFAIHDLNKQALRESTTLYAQWAQLPNEERHSTPAPPIRQLLLDNTTTEAAAKALRDNPEGVILVLPELSEWVGRMDAYSGGHGGDKDRGAWIRAFDGGPVSINRAKDPIPMLLDNFSAAMLAGIQPEKLAQMFSKSAAGGADGLFQRFVHYCVAPPGEVDYSASMPVFLEPNVSRVFQVLAEWRSSGVFKFCKLSPEATKEAENHHNLLRVLSRRTPAGRFAEHIDKLPGLTLRVAFALHVLHAAAEGREAPAPVVLPETFRMALTVMRVLYRHAEAAYAQLDHTGVSAVIKLAKAACEAILSQAWPVLQRGDLTRYATGWSGADERHAEAAIDLLIDWQWLADVTPATPAGKRGRRSMGRYQVNPVALQRFEPHAQRIARERTERHQAIQRLALARKEAD